MTVCLSLPVACTSDISEKIKPYGLSTATCGRFYVKKYKPGGRRGCFLQDNTMNLYLYSACFVSLCGSGIDFFFLGGLQCACLHGSIATIGCNPRQHHAQGHETHTIPKRLTTFPWRLRGSCCGPRTGCKGKRTPSLIYFNSAHSQKAKTKFVSSWLTQLKNTWATADV